MQLEPWLREQGLTNIAFARLLGVSHTTVGRWLTGETFPSRLLRHRIYNITGGMVTLADFDTADLHEAVTPVSGS